MYTSKPFTSIAILKQTDHALRQVLLISSNAYMDRAGDIVKQKALETYIKEAYVDNQYVGDNMLLFWHGGDPLGVIVEAAMYGPFLVELAEELPDEMIDLARDGEPPLVVSRKAVWDAIESDPEGWGASIGFRAIKGDQQDKEFNYILKHETSLLPLVKAANPFTFAQIIGGYHA